MFLAARANLVRRIAGALLCCGLGCAVADARRAETGADLALINGGAFRSDRIYEAGPLTRLDIKRLLPFENLITVLKIKGSALCQALEHGLARVVREGGSGAMPHVSGLRLRYDATRPDGARIAPAVDGRMRAN